MIDYFLTLTIAFAGVFAGGLLAIISPEELKPGEKYWKILKWVLLAVIITVLFYFSQLIIYAIIITALLVYLKIINREYPALAFVFFLSAYEGFLFIASSLIFIYGLPAGTLDAKQIIGQKSKGKLKKAMLLVTKKNVSYLIIGAALPIIMYFLTG